MNIPFRSTAKRAPPPLPPRKSSSLNPLPPRGDIKFTETSTPNRAWQQLCRASLQRPDSPCSYYGRCVEPLAWNIEHELVRYQDQCPLFTVIPKELRDLIFEFALTDGMEQSLESIIKRNASYISIRIENQKLTNDIAVNLLRTCRSIYLDTWDLPLSLNPLSLQTRNRRKTRHEALHAAPMANSTDPGPRHDTPANQPRKPQIPLYINRYWLPSERHKGVYASPNDYKTIQALAQYATVPTPLRGLETPTDFSFLSTEFMPAKSNEPRHFLSHVLGETLDQDPPLNYHTTPPCASMRARPLIHLTLRLQHQNWWSWTDDPASADDTTHHLGLDPRRRRRPSKSIFAPHRATHACPCRNAAQRHASRVSSGDWVGAQNRAMPDLKRLELVLETFRSKKAQLEDVVRRVRRGFLR